MATGSKSPILPRSRKMEDDYEDVLLEEPRKARKQGNVQWQQTDGEWVEYPLDETGMKFYEGSGVRQKARKPVLPSRKKYRSRDRV